MNKQTPNLFAEEVSSFAIPSFFFVLILAHGNGDINAEITIVGKQMCNASIKYKTVAV